MSACLIWIYICLYVMYAGMHAWICIYVFIYLIHVLCMYACLNAYVCMHAYTFNMCMYVCVKEEIWLSSKDLFVTVI